MPSTQTILTRLVSSLALWFIVLAFVFSGWNPGVWLVITVFGLIGQWEFYLAQEAKGFHVYKKSGVVCGFLFFLNSLIFLVLIPEQSGFFSIGAEIILVLCFLAALVRLILSGEPKETPIVSLALTLLGFIYVPYLFNYVARISFWPGHLQETRFLLLYLLAVTKFTDVGAYVVGSLVGRHKMSPGISPGKTWEGFAGGMIFALGTSLFVTWLCRGQLGGITWTDAILLGLLLPIASTLGDLAESVVKRDAALKDSGCTIPGIGGSLDLIDSLLFTAPVLYFYLYLVV